MKKYNTEDYFSVIETKTGRKILDCGEEKDALAMVAFDPANRSILRNKFLMGQVNPKPGQRAFECELEWILRPQNWAKLIEGKYHAV
jgi:hypothetical protein